jgi:hypothetical protein
MVLWRPEVGDRDSQGPGDASFRRRRDVERSDFEALDRHVRRAGEVGQLPKAEPLPCALLSESTQVVSGDAHFT